MMKTEFEKNIGYGFKDRELLSKATTHSSYVREQSLGREMCNERLEFLGDAFFDAVIGEKLYGDREKASEGSLSKIRADIVCEGSLARKGRQVGISQMLKLGKGELATNGMDKDSIIADAMEAVMGAIYLEAGYDTVKKVILKLFDDIILEALDGKLNLDYKSKLQEKLQKNGSVEIEYVIEKEEGPAHSKVFFVDVLVNNKLRGSGQGKSKKEAEQMAAKAALVGDN